MKHIWSLLAAVLLLWSCAPELAPELPDDDDVEVELCFNLPIGPETRSAVITQDEDRIKDMIILVYRRNRYDFSNPAGTLVASRACGPFGGVVHIANVNQRRYVYSFYALANCGFKDDIDFPRSEREIKSWSMELTDPQTLDGYIPMAWSLANVTLGSSLNNKFTIHYKRLMSRIDFSLDKTALEGIDITSLRLRQSAMDVTPFTLSSKAMYTADCDYASDEDLRILNAGGTASFYALENCRGNLLAGNTDSWKKVPDNLSPYEASLCTYLELRGEFKPEASHTGAVTYRIYLGSNPTSNFDIVRNTVNNIRLTLSEDGLGCGVDWKVDVSELGRGFGYELSRDVLYLAQKAVLTITGGEVTDLHIGGTGAISIVPADGNGSLGTTTGSYEISALKAGVDTIYISGTDIDGSDISRKIPIVVTAPILGFDDSELYLPLDGAEKTILPHYYDLEGHLMTDFDPDLYEALLMTSYAAEVAGTHVDSRSDSDGFHAWINALDGIEAAGQGSMATKLSMGTIQAYAVSPDVERAEAAIYTGDPFPASSSLGSYVSRGLLADDDETLRLSYGTIREFSDTTAYRIICGSPAGDAAQTAAVKATPAVDIAKAAPAIAASKTTTATAVPAIAASKTTTATAVPAIAASAEIRSRCWIEGETIHAEWLYGRNGDLYVPSTSETFSACVVNRWSGDVWWSPRTWTASFTVHVAIGGDVFYAGGIATNPMSYYVRAVWSHTHNEASPLQAFQSNIVAADEAYHGFYNTGMYGLLYSLDYMSGYPTSNDDIWYKTNSPHFTIVDVSADNYLNPETVTTPYSVTDGLYNLIVHNWSDISADGSNWVR